MPLPSFLQRLRASEASRPAAVPLSQAELELTRVRARRRLIGMVVLVGAGVIGFPWLFETEPRPLPVQAEMVQAHGPVAATPAATRNAGRVAVATIVPPAEPRAAEPERAPAVQPQRPTEPVAPPQAAKPAPKPVAKAPAAPAPAPAAKAAEPKADEDKASTRYVVQFGAFADAQMARQTRLKAERAGIKTYAQQVDTPNGKRIRLRVGPFNDRAQAEKQLAALRKAGLDGAILTL